MKRLLSLFLASTLMLTALTGCGEKKEAEGATEAKPTVIQIGYENNPGEPLDLAVNKWKDLVAEQSNGTLEIEVFPSSQLGAKNDLIDQMIAGEPVITLADGAFYADRGVPDFGIVFSPFLFDSWEDCWKLTESDWYKEQCSKLEGQGLKIVTSNWIYGERHTMTKKPVNSAADLKGMKIRVPNNKIQIKGFEVLGATPTPMPLGDVYTALQQGTIDGLENPLPVLYNGKFQEVAKNLILDGHVKNFTTWVCGADFFNTLTKEQQDLLISTASEAGLYNNELQEQAMQDTLEKFKSEGVTVVEPSAEVLEQFKAEAAKFYELPDFADSWTPGLYDTVKAAMK